MAITTLNCRCRLSRLVERDVAVAAAADVAKLTLCVNLFYFFNIVVVKVLWQIFLRFPPFDTKNNFSGISNLKHVVFSCLFIN